MGWKRVNIKLVLASSLWKGKLVNEDSNKKGSNTANFQSLATFKLCMLA